MLPLILSIIFALSGFSIAYYIHRKKRTKTNLVCPMKGHCDSVVYSQFSSFFGISVELLGMGYYAVVVLGYLAILAAPNLLQSPFCYSLILFTGGAFMFSLYLVFVQVFSIRQYCTWCLTSALLSTLIAAMTVWHASEVIVMLLQQYEHYVLAVGWLGLALGLGVATLTHLLYFRFLKDRCIDAFEAQILRLGSQVQWFAAALVVLGWWGTMTADWQALRGDMFMWTEMIILCVLLLASAVLDLVVMPRLLRISANEEHAHRDNELATSAYLAHAVGPVALVSWYALFVLMIIGMYDAPAWSSVLLAYGIALLAAVGVGYLVERFTQAAQRD